MKQRLLSLDVLRGITMAFMILVNTAGDGSVSYSQLRHSVWNGLTVTDCVFPMFLFIVGASIFLSLRSRVQSGATRATLLKQIGRRSLLIFVIGLTLNLLSVLSIRDLRYCGVLQRIAVCYAAGSLVYLFKGVKGALWGVAVALGGYWLLMSQIPVPGFGMPGISQPIADPQGNLAAWLDRAVIPVAHRYHHSFYDPEGVLSTLPAIGTTLSGIVAAAWLQTARPFWQRVSLMAACGAVSVALGLLWALEFPINKRLWTSSYVLLAAGLSMLALAWIAWLVDGSLKVRRGLLPWLVFGTNALTAYVVSETLALVLAAIKLPGGENVQEWLYHLLPHWLGPPPFLSLIYSILYVITCFMPVDLLYRKRIFLKI